LTINELRKICQPAYKKKVDPLMEWYLLRPISIYFTWFFTRVGLSANWVTFIGLVSACIGSALLMTGNLQWAVFGAILIWLGFLFDCVDGEVARFSNKGSLSGTYLDYFVGGVNDMAIMLGLSFYISLTTGWSTILIVSAGVALAYLEKIIGLYAHSVIYRNIRGYWDKVESDDDTDDYEKKVWKEMGLMSRLLRVPFETFFRATLILLAFLAEWLSGFSGLVIAAWALIMLLGWVLVVKSFYSEFFGGRVSSSMDDFIGALKTRD